MRGISLSVLTSAAVLGIAFAQSPSSGPPADAKSSNPAPGSGLDDVLAKALAHSPEVQIAEAKLREAEAELRRTRLGLVQRVIDLQGTIEASKRQVGLAEIALARVSKLAGQNMASKEDLQQHERMLADAKAIVARGESTLATLTGSMPEKFQHMLVAGVSVRGLLFHGADSGGGAGIGLGGGIGEGDGRPIRPPHPGMAEKIRKALDTPVKAADFTETPLKDVIEYYRELSGQVPFVASLGGSGDNPITLKLSKELPLGAHLQALQDVAPGLLISVRNYGLFLTFDIPPEDSMSYLDFWHGKAGTAEMRNKE
jgi:hypothetical protein